MRDANLIFMRRVYMNLSDGLMNIDILILT